MPLTPRLGLVYPALADDPDVPDDMRKLAISVENAAIGWKAGDFKYSFQNADHDQFILCDGNPRVRADFSATYLALIDATLGAHPDPTKVKTPNGRRRALMGAEPAGTLLGGVVPNLGALGGEELHALAAAEGATKAHTHPVTNSKHLNDGGGILYGYVANDAFEFAAGQAKGVHYNIDTAVDASANSAGAGHNTVGPYLAANLFIATGGGGAGVGGGGGGIEPPADVLHATPNLAPAAGESGVITLGAGYRVLRVVSDQIARVRLYTTPAKRDTDIARPLIVDPPDYPAVGAAPNHGCMLEVVLSAAHLVGGVYVQDLAPNVVGSSGEGPRSNDIAFRVDNTDVAAHVINLTLTSQALETV